MDATMARAERDPSKMKQMLCRAKYLIYRVVGGKIECAGASLHPPRLHHSFLFLIH